MLDKIYLCGILELGGGDRPLHRRSAAPASGEGDDKMKKIENNRCNYCGASEESHERDLKTGCEETGEFCPDCGKSYLKNN